MVRLTPNQLSERVLSEQGAGKLGADVIRTSDYPIALSMEKAGVWKKYVPPVDAKFSGLSLDGGMFNLVFDSVYTIGYNNALVDASKAPKSWADLVSGQWKKKIGIVQGGSGGSTAALNRFMIERLGDDYFKEIRQPGAGHLQLSRSGSHCAGPRRGSGRNRQGQRSERVGHERQGAIDVRGAHGGRGCLRLLSGHDQLREA
ncbi:hypothetical protein CDEF62S_05169 [Castellaniella defragrans]